MTAAQRTLPTIPGMTGEKFSIRIARMYESDGEWNVQITRTEENQSIILFNAQTPIAMLSAMHHLMSILQFGFDETFK